MGISVSKAWFIRRVFAESNSIELSLAKTSYLIPNRFLLLFAVSNSIVKSLYMKLGGGGNVYVEGGGAHSNI